MMVLNPLKKGLTRIRMYRQKDVFGKYKTLHQQQWLAPEEYEQYVHAKMSALLKHACKHVPFYRDNIGVNELIHHNVIDWPRFMQIPLLTKEIIREHYGQLISEDIQERKWFEETSGGSTGEPIRFIQDEDTMSWMLSLKLLYDQWTGRVPGDRQIRLWGSMRDLLIGKETMRTYVGRWMRNERWINAYRMDKERVKMAVHSINEYKPKQILAYVESIYELAQYIEHHQVSIHHPHSIMTTAGVLFPHMRQTIEDVFQTKVYNRYGSREVGDIACECEQHKGLHVSGLTHYVEVLREDGTPAAPHEVGEIVVTPLCNFSMPLIRYRIGDLGVWSDESCTCGRPFKLLKEVTGRISDTFINANGTKIQGTYFSQLFFYQDWVKQYQIIQETVERVKVFVVLKHPEVGLSGYEAEIQMIDDQFKAVLGEGCDITYEHVEAISPQASGKYRYLISHVMA
ncbi:phenylacetate--CoA ligase family protein [Paenibacillus sp. OSY-SE]|uniref:phenylacetate--CoA ligase family protein n=1 Tax=Paenibacillus sp. OSY-SE TaxID=1196323 RepID=UPI0012F71497|nr:hypothetical protein [Paenibacillus sp. OSY-SE]